MISPSTPLLVWFLVVSAFPRVWLIRVMISPQEAVNLAMSKGVANHNIVGL
jgi:hypothetical protein